MLVNLINSKTASIHRKDYNLLKLFSLKSLIDSDGYSKFQILISLILFPKQRIFPSLKIFKQRTDSDDRNITYLLNYV